MGLDMYLSARRYTSQYTDKDANEQLTPIADKLLPPDGNFGCVVISRDVAYWRKANAIHNWFVQNVQEGNDDCGRYSVSMEQLQELRDECLKVLDNPESAKEVLPTVDGFFFGGTDYDEGYLDELKGTVEQIDKILAWVGLAGVPEHHIDFEYHSSW
jgi:hypothetical protein